jgi:hypothetical protein
VALLKTVKSGLILALVPFLLACEDDNFLSLPADSSQQNLDIRRKRIPVPFQIVRQDSIDTSKPLPNSGLTDRNRRLLAGRQATALGVAEATTFMEFDVGPRTAVGDTAAYQSLELELLYERSIGATQDTRQSLEVRRLTQRFNDSLNFYYNSDDLAYADQALGTVATDTKFSGELDTLRFRLDNTLGQAIFDLAQAGDSTVLSSPRFREFLPGLAIVPSATNTFVSSFDASHARLIMNFTNAQGEVKEHTFAVRRYFSRVTGDYTGTALAGLTEPGSRVVPTDGNLYLQSGAGIAPRIGLDSLLAFMRSQTNEQQSVRLNRVDFNLGLRNAQDTLNAPPALFIYDFVLDSLGLLQRTPVSDGRGGIAGYRGVPGDQSTPPQATALVLDGTQYTLPITNYASAVVESDTLSQRLYLWASNFDASLSHFVTPGDSIYLDVNYTVLTRTD